jgi:hypothetical protein
MFSRRKSLATEYILRQREVDWIYRTHFAPRKADARYSDMTDTDLIYRCLGIILESIGFSGGQNEAGDKIQIRGSAPSGEE